METSQNLLSNELLVDSRIAAHLKESSGWARFLGITGFVLSGILAIVAFAYPSMQRRSYYSYDTYSSYSYSGKSTGEVIAMVILYLLGAALTFFLALFAFRFGAKIKDALAMNDQQSLDKGMMNLKFLFRFYGIVVIVYLAIIVLAVIAILVEQSMRG